MKPAFLLALVTLFAVSLTFAQAGPKQKDKVKPDTTRTEKKIEKPSKSKAEPDTTKGEKKAQRPAKPKPAPEPAAAEDKKTGKPKAPEIKKPVPRMPKNQAAGLSSHLKRALFTTAIEEHEPVGNVDSLSTAADQIYFFTEIVGLADRTVTHRWRFDGEVQAEVEISVGSPRWRAYSSKKFLPAWTGEWTVEVVDADGNVLGTKRFVYYNPDRD